MMTYTELKAAIAEWAHRANIPAATVDTFIDLAEAEFNNRLRCSEQETVDTFTVTARLTALPSDFLEMRAVEYEGESLHCIQYATPEYMSYWRSYSSATGEPKGYSIRGDELEVIPAQSGTDLTIHYWAKITPLSDANTSNWLLAAHPNMYLYESLRQLSIYTKDDRAVERYAGQLQGYWDALKRADKAKRFGGSALRVRVA